MDNPTVSVPAETPPRGSLRKRLHLPSFDIPFFVGILLLLAVGLLMLYSAGFAGAFLKKGDSYFYIRRQALFAAVGLIAMLVISFIPYNFYRKWIIPFYLGCMVLLILVYLIPTNDTEHRWLYIGGIQFQPSEFAKIGVIIALADYMARNQKKMKTFSGGIVRPAVIFGLPMLAILFETHLSGAILVASIGIVMMLCGGSKPIQTLLVALAGALGAGGVLSVTGYMIKRVTTWLNPESDAFGDGWQILQSLITIGSGGMFGLGYGKSRQKYLYMSEPQNDFIFSIVSEELGFIGVLFVLALFAFLIWRGIEIAIHAPDAFSSLVVIGIITRIAVQVILNLAVVTNTVPVTGISLPFFSYGGTSLLVLLCEMGIVLQISRYSGMEKGSE